MTEPSPANFVNRIFFGYQNAAVLKAALELDVFTAIGSGTLDVATLAAKAKASPRGIAALCDSLSVMGFLAKSSAGYALTPDAAAFLDRKSPACIAKLTQRMVSHPTSARHVCWQWLTTWTLNQRTSLPVAMACN